MVTRLRKRWPALLGFTLVVIMVIVLDRISKDIAVKVLNAGPLPFIPGVLEFRLAFNSGAAWGVFAGGRYVFVAIALICVLLAIAYLLWAREMPNLIVIAIGFFIGGSIGNAIDRLASGHVVDFLHPLFIEFPIFNLADSSLTVGVILLLISILFLPSGKSKSKTVQPDSADDLPLQ